MLNETFYIDGEDAKSVGIRLQKALEFSEPVPIYEKEHVPGRNGDLIFFTNSFNNRTAIASCFLLEKNVTSIFGKLNRFFFGKNGYRKLETSDDPDHYWLARINNGAKVYQMARTLAPFDLQFDCKPQRFVKSGNDANEFLTNGTLKNFFGFDALPLISVYGSGSGILTIGEVSVDVKELDGVLHIDSETQNAYNDSGNQNMNIEAAEFPVLHYGENEVSFSGGIKKVIVFPRWWEL